MHRRNDSSSVGTETAVVVQVAEPNAPSNSSSFRRRRRDGLASNRGAATSKQRAPTNCADATSTDPETTSGGSSSRALLQAVGSSATDTTDDPSRRSRACKTFASPLRALAPLLLRREDPALVEIVVEQRRRQRVASQKWRLVLRDGIDRTTRAIEAFRTQKTAAPWLMRLTGTAIEECVFCATNCVMLGPGLEKEKP